MRFVKMHGIGNDYVYLDAVTHPEIAARDDLPDLARRMSDRHTGIGSDGLILVCRPESSDAHVCMRMFNADGSESAMCGNGVRCVAKFAHDRLSVNANPMRIETGTRVLSIEYEVIEGRLTTATVDMGEPIFELADVPVDRAGLVRVLDDGVHAEFDAAGERFKAVFVSMGNPHAVIFIDDVSGLDLGRIGPQIERHRAFPERINAHFAQIRSRAEATMRTWERGSGITQACGTGACAVCVAGVRTGRLDREVLLHLPGGDLRVRWDELTNHVFMTGPATDVFEGDWPE
ncbi:MAG: diaminopimelate epimerase [Planctomycetes bacterium]|nr:diaminopimelate epimerase [Planctomycetota bacterium]